MKKDTLILLGLVGLGYYLHKRSKVKESASTLQNIIRLPQTVINVDPSKVTKGS